MGHRLSRIYTRTGDDGTTGLANGERVPKTDARIEAIGAVDETSSALGLILAEDGVDESLRDCLLRIQHDLFEIGAELSLPGYCGIQARHVEHLETELDGLNSALPPLKEFILPGGNRAAAACHLARTFCRRAERRAWAVSGAGQTNSDLLRYLNRLSDYLFVAARTLARTQGGSETLWQREHRT